MGKLSDKVYENRAARDAVRTLFDERLARVKGDLETRSVGGRVADKISEQARGAYEEARAVAGENKGVVAGTFAALALWFLRNPIIAALDHVLSDANIDDEESEHDAIDE